MTDVVVERHLDAPVDAVWRALTSPQALQRWFWPPHFATAAEVELQPGGQYRIASPVAGMAVSGRYLSVRAPERLEFGWRWDGEELTSTVGVELTSGGGGTGVVVTHSGLADEEVAQHMQGWSDCLDRLPGYLAGQ